MVIDNKGNRMAFFIKNNQGVEKQFVLTEGITITNYDTYFLALVCNKNFPITIKLTGEEVNNFHCVKNQEECECLKNGKITFSVKDSTNTSTPEKEEKENNMQNVLEGENESLKEASTENTDRDETEENTDVTEKKRRGRKKQD